MRMLMNVVLPTEPFNAAMRAGTAGETIGKILAAVKPEVVYFTDQEGQRGATLVIHVSDASEIPALAEPWYLSFNAKCTFRIAMVPEDLKRANLDGFGKAWG
jgi:hypothetical protein